MPIFDNVNTIVRDDLAKTITKGSRLSMAAACFLGMGRGCGGKNVKYISQYL